MVTDARKRAEAMLIFRLVPKEIYGMLYLMNVFLCWK